MSAERIIITGDALSDPDRINEILADAAGLAVKHDLTYEFLGEETEEYWVHDRFGLEPIDFHKLTKVKDAQELGVTSSTASIAMNALRRTRIEEIQREVTIYSDRDFIVSRAGVRAAIERWEGVTNLGLRSVNFLQILLERTQPAEEES